MSFFSMLAMFVAQINGVLPMRESAAWQDLAMVSHDMRTPLNAVIGYLGLVQDSKPLPKESMGFISSAQHAAAHLLTVINDLLDFSQIRLGQLTLNPQTIAKPFDRNMLIRAVRFYTVGHQQGEL